MRSIQVNAGVVSAHEDLDVVGARRVMPTPGARATPPPPRAARGRAAGRAGRGVGGCPWLHRVGRAVPASSARVARCITSTGLLTQLCPARARLVVVALR